MPIFDYKCQDCEHVEEVFFPTFSSADEAEEREKTSPRLCTQKMGDDTGDTLCMGNMTRQLGVPQPAMFFGNPEGYHKPSPLKRHSTKLVSSRTGNQNAVG